MFTNPEIRSRPARPRMMRATAMLDRTISASTSDNRRRIAPGRRTRACGGSSEAESPAADERDQAAKQKLAERQRLIEKEPEDEEAGRQERKRQEPCHLSPRVSACRCATGCKTSRM